ncbi:hypothetical protein PNEG_01636 [Pneumocystis murina B123]|uniref:Protection of telomeres protein 1 n=1 Tax=Pneumocystis murina (strain B123) TaxID=1069680 RepID=M7PIW2_PNEMU|nr:hypothetical protein PNEG_01636 [Pneumocystis murina B123]EMR10384.1 hypothetical protein PNEG_01636 [Pneumocystis murina B123]
MSIESFPSNAVYYFRTQYNEYQYISNLQTGSIVNLTGIVASFKDSRKSRGTDFTNSCIIFDKSCAIPGGGLLINFFRPLKKDLPLFNDDTGAILLRNLRINPYNINMQGISRIDTEWILFDKKGNMQSKSNNKISLLFEEETFIKDLCFWWKDKSGLAHGIISKKRPILIRDIIPNSFYEIIGEIVKTFPINSNGYTIYLTDYTSNSLLHSYEWGMSSKWNGPYGKMTIQCSLWDSTAMFARNKLYEGEIVQVSNLLGRLNRDGILEGVVHGDKQYPDKIFITKPSKDNFYVKELIARKSLYNKKFLNDKKILKEISKENQYKEKTTVLTSSANINLNIVCAHQHIPITQIGDILSSLNPKPLYVAQKFRIRARVIDFLPVNLEDFARPFCKSCQETYIKKCRCYSVYPLDEVFIWQFAFLFEGQDSACIPVIFFGDDAQMLLNNESIMPTNLRKDKKTLALLRQKLSLIYGDLEETLLSGQHYNHIQTPWFELCIMEYIVHESKTGKEQRRWRAFGIKLI